MGVNMNECDHSAYDANVKLLRIKLTKHLTKVKIKAAISSSIGEKTSRKKTCQKRR